MSYSTRSQVHPLFVLTWSILCITIPRVETVVCLMMTLDELCPSPQPDEEEPCCAVVLQDGIVLASCLLFKIFFLENDTIGCHCINYNHSESGLKTCRLHCSHAASTVQLIIILSKYNVILHDMVIQYMQSPLGFFLSSFIIQ